MLDSASKINQDTISLGVCVKKPKYTRTGPLLVRDGDARFGHVFFNWAEGITASDDNQSPIRCQIVTWASAIISNRWFHLPWCQYTAATVISGL